MTAMSNGTNDEGTPTSVQLLSLALLTVFGFAVFFLLWIVCDFLWTRVI